MSKTPVTPDVSDFENEQQLEQMRAALRNVTRQLSVEKNRTTEIVNAIHTAALEAALSAPSVKVTPPKRDRRTRNAEVALLHCSDWQTGKRTESYDSSIAAERITLLSQKVRSIVDIQRSDHPVRACVVAYGGDMVEGISIFPGQPFQIDSTLYEQLFFTAALMESQVRTLAEVFETVDVFTEYGNHGRIGKKGEFPAQDNIDLMAYAIAQLGTKDLTNVTWHLSTNWFNMIEIGNYRALLVHGDEVKSFGGQTPAFGILRKVSAWATGVIEGNWSDCLMGHWHQPLTLPIPRGGRVFVSPSLESGNEYAREFVANTGRPGQRLMFVNPEKGEITAEYLLWLD